MSKNVRRLIKNFQPQNYKITLDPDRDTMTLQGSVIISGKKLGPPSHRITFHQSGLKIIDATIIKHDKKATQSIEVARISHHKSFDEVRLHTTGQLFAGQYEVRLNFKGKITRQMDGVYPCFYKQDGQEKQLIATQFESHHARQAFPCIDEPEAKATFDLTLASPIGETVLANTPIKDQKEAGGKLITSFETTPKMSTYLLAFAYGEFEHLEKTTKNGTLVRTFATKQHIKNTEFALDTAVQCLEYFEEYFAIPFPLAKCDFVALPDFASGAMENWGLITFREHALLVDPDNTSLPVKQYVAEVVCHELTHQWFGNLVTMRWWTDLWLNEGFANVMAYMAVDRLFPDWQMMTQYIVEEQQLALKLDALENTHPIEVPVRHPDEIRTIFDSISYSKGGSCILMLSKYLGAEAFRDGLRYYLKKHSYDNTDTTDLWEALEHVSKKPVRKMMSAWTSQPGYPVIKVSSDGSRVALKQEQFFVSPVARQNNKANRLWPIALEGGPNVPDMMTKETFSFISSNPDKLKLNQGQSSFCRVIYDQDHIDKLAGLIRNNKLSPLDRLGVLGDAFEAAKSGYSETVSALQLLDAFEAEDSDVVWDIIVGNFATIRNIMNDEELREAMKPFGRKLGAKQLARLGFEPKKDDSHFDRLLRPTIISLAAISDDKTAVEFIQSRFKSMTKSSDLDPDMRGIIYTDVARRGGKAEFDKMLALHNASDSPEERIALTAGLTSFKQPDLIDEALGLIISDTVRLQDVIYWISYSFGNRFAREATWQWLKKNWSWLKENLGSDMSFTRMPVYVARVISDDSFLPEYKAFFESQMEPAIERAYKQGLEMIEWQSAWRKRDLVAIKTYFK